MTTASAAPTGEITLPTQFTRLRTVPSGWAAVCPCTAWPVCGDCPRFWALDTNGENWNEQIISEIDENKAAAGVSPIWQSHMLLFWIALESRVSLISALHAGTYGRFRFRTNRDGRWDCFQNCVAGLQSAESRFESSRVLRCPLISKDEVRSTARGSRRIVR